MITPILERLILTGRAAKWNKVHGLSGAGRIKCPTDRFLIITDIWYYPFMDNTFLDIQEQAHQLNLRSSNGQEMQNYIFRNNCWLDPQQADNIISSDVIHMNVLDVFTSDVVITITKSAPYNGGGLDFIALDAQAQQQLPPNGYGISTPVVKRAVDTNLVEIVPAGIENFLGLGATGRASEDYRFDTVLGQSQLAQPVNNMQTPIVNFTVVSVNSKDLQNEK